MELEEIGERAWLCRPRLSRELLCRCWWNGVVSVISIFGQLDALLQILNSSTLPISTVLMSSEWRAVSAGLRPSLDRWIMNVFISSIEVIY
jgi:hypothetical protein